MQHPAGYAIAPNGTLALADVGAFLLNPWGLFQYTHNQCAALVTGSFAISAMGAFYTLRGMHAEQARVYLNTGTLVGLVASLLVAFPTGDSQAKMVVGNIARGVALTADGTFYLPFFTNFDIRGNVGLLDWYTVPMSLFCLLILTAYGSTCLTMKTTGAVHARSIKLARRLWVAVIPAFAIITILTWFVRQELLAGIAVRPVTWVTLVMCVASVYAIVTGLRHQREHIALRGSSFLLFGLLVTGAAALFPVMLLSTTDANFRLTAPDCAAAGFSLAIAIAWWIPALILAVAYFYIIQRYYSGKVNVSKDNQGLY